MEATTGQSPRQYTIEERPARHVAPIVFVGGTGRSGTHVVAKLLGRHFRLHAIPVECRFHVEERGFPGLLAGEVDKEAFLERLRGFWWKGFQTRRMRGMFRFVPRERFDPAVATFDRRFDEDRVGACRGLFLDLLWPDAVAHRASGLVEQSCDTVAAAPTLTRIFPEARFVHVVRDGRDASASRVAQTHGLIYPRTRHQGLEWWESRVRAIDAGARAIDEARLLELGLHDLLTDSSRTTVRRLARFAGVRFGRRMRRFYLGEMDTEAANTERWRRGLSAPRRAEINRRYEAILSRFEADGISCAPILRRAYEQSPGEAA
jgi:hypothetical protein